MDCVLGLDLALDTVGLVGQQSGLAAASPPENRTLLRRAEAQAASVLAVTAPPRASAVIPKDVAALSPALYIPLLSLRCRFCNCLRSYDHDFGGRRQCWC